MGQELLVAGASRPLGNLCVRLHSRSVLPRRAVFPSNITSPLLWPCACPGNWPQKAPTGTADFGYCYLWSNPETGSVLTYTCCSAQTAEFAWRCPASQVPCYCWKRPRNTPKCACVLLSIKNEWPRGGHDLLGLLHLPQLLKRCTICTTGRTGAEGLKIYRLYAQCCDQLHAPFIYAVHFHEKESLT